MRVIDFFDKGVDLFPRNAAFIEGGVELTYAESWEWTMRIAAGMRFHGYGRRSRAGILAPNSVSAFVTFLGLLRADCVWLPVNPRNAVGSNIEFLARTECEVLFFHSSMADTAGAITEAVTSLRECVQIDDESGPLGGIEAWAGMATSCFEPELFDLDEYFTLFPTGGTTGDPKAVMITHRNQATMYATLYAHFSYDEHSRHLVVAPMTHTAGLLGAAHFAHGGTNVVVSDTRPESVLRNIDAFKITHLFVPPTLLYGMLQVPGAQHLNLSSMRHLFVGSAPSSIGKKMEAVELFGPVITETFGQSEAPMVITVMAPKDYLRVDGSINEKRLASVGCASALTRVALLDDDGKPVPRGERGEICARGDLVTPGYYGNEEATALIRRFGWHHTGDVGLMDEDGYITVVGRTKDLIISGGFNVYPLEVERALSAHAGVIDCAVIGVPDERWGEAVKAVVQPAPDVQISEGELISYAKTLLGSVKAPKSVDFVAALPKSPLGKVLKTELRKKYWEGYTRDVN